MLSSYYEQDGITIYHGDCLDVLPELGSVDSVIADPPYGTTQCRWDEVIDIDRMWRELLRVCPNGPIVLCAGQPFASRLVVSRLEMFRHDIIWDKVSATGHLNAKRAPMRCHEHVLVFCDGQPTYNPQKRKRDEIYKRRLRPAPARGEVSKQKGVYGQYNRDLQGNVDRDHTFPVSIVTVPNRGGWAKARQNHPTQKPEELMGYLVVTYTNDGETVLDFAMGSGTTLLAAKLAGRKAVGIEIEEKYCEQAADRLRQGVLPFAG